MPWPGWARHPNCSDRIETPVDAPDRIGSTLSPSRRPPCLQSNRKDRFMPDLMSLSPARGASLDVATPPAKGRNGPSRSGVTQALRAEMLKLRSLRSTKWVMFAMVVGSLLVTFLATHTV